jgi:hypothetical protein
MPTFTRLRLFALAAKIYQTEPNKTSYVSFDVRFQGHFLTFNGGRFPKDFILGVGTACPSLYYTKTVDVISQVGRRETARVLVAFKRYIKDSL